MAWVTLFNLLAKDKNLYGCVPVDAIVIPTLPSLSPDNSEMLIKIRGDFKRHFDGKTKVTPHEYSAFIAKSAKLPLGVEISLKEFSDQYSFASRIEWLPTSSGYLKHVAEGLSENANKKTWKKNPYFFINYLDLDLAPWFKTATDEQILTYVCLSRMSCPKDTTEIVPFRVKTKYGDLRSPIDARIVYQLYERIGRTLPDEYKPIQGNEFGDRNDIKTVEVGI